MRYLADRMISAIALVFVLVGSCFAQTSVRVDETAIRVHVHSDSTLVDFPVENQTRETISSHVLLELVDPKGLVQVHSDQDASLPPGSTKLEIALPPAFAQNENSDQRSLLWYRLRYTITSSSPGGSSLMPIVGIISVGEATPEIFELHVAGPAFVKAGGHYAVRVRSIHPVTARPVPGVSVRASLDLDTDDRKPLLTTRTALTDRGGFATLEFTLPENVETDEIEVKVTGKLGNLSANADGDFRVNHFSNVSVSTDKPLYQPGQALHARLMDSGAASVKISRYELPSFTVTTKPDQTHYLPDQNASVEIRAEYLFGEPVRHGHVRLARETERQWNYREQKWDIKEDETYEGDADDHGRYVAKVDLTKDHRQLQGDDYERFRDLTFAAYYTDSSTGRTEQRRFDLRVTKDPIHVYVIESSSPQSNGLPLEFYLSTEYADGSPAQCDVEISWVDTHQPSRNTALSAQVEQPLRRIHTNRYGVAKVSGLTIPSAGDSNDSSLSFRARDHRGELGHHIESMWYSDKYGIRVATDKTLYKAGEPIEVQLATNQPEVTVVVEAVHDFQVLDSRLVHVRHGHADVVFDGGDKFQNDVTILAYAFGLRPGDDYYGRELQPPVTDRQPPHAARSQPGGQRCREVQRKHSSRLCIAAPSRAWDTIKPSGHRPSTMPADLVDLAPGSPLRRTRPGRYQTIQAKAHGENDSATPNPRLSGRTTKSSTPQSSASAVIFDPVPNWSHESDSRHAGFSGLRVICRTTGCGRIGWLAGQHT